MSRRKKIAAVSALGDLLPVLVIGGVVVGVLWYGKGWLSKLVAPFGSLGSLGALFSDLWNGRMGLKDAVDWIGQMVGLGWRSLWGKKGDSATIKTGTATGWEDFDLGADLATLMQNIPIPSRLPVP